MKSFVRLSIVANFVFAGLVVSLLPRARLVKSDSAARSIRGSAKVECAVSPEPSTTPCDQPRQEFRWSQLESTDYATYVANLRRIGCPEQTIRDIIVADVHSLYARRIVESGNRGPDQDFHRLQAAEALVIAALLGPENASGESSPRHRRHVERISLPLALQTMDANLSNLTEQQRSVIDSLREQFQEQVGGQSLDPKDPAYRELWVKAQRENDDLLQGLLGSEFYLEFQLRTSGAAAAASL